MKNLLLLILSILALNANAQETLPTPYPGSKMPCEIKVNKLFEISNNAKSCGDVENWLKTMQDINENGCVASWGMMNQPHLKYMNKSVKKIEGIINEKKCGQGSQSSSANSKETVSDQDLKRAANGSFDDKRAVFKKYFEERGFKYLSQGKSRLIFSEEDDSINENAYTLNFESFKIILKQDNSVGIYISTKNENQTSTSAKALLENNFELGGAGDEDGSAWYVLKIKN